MITLEQYIEACTFPGRLDERAVETALHKYLKALGVKRKVVRLNREWTLDQHPSLKKNVTAIFDDFSKRRAAQDARVALDALDALAAQDARDARVARVAQDALDALAALAARDARVAQDALAALAAQDARDALVALPKFASWCILRQWHWYGCDLSYVVTTAIGAQQLKKTNVLTWSEPLANAFVAGCWSLYWTEDTVFWIAKPSLKKLEDRRLHCPDGPAFICDIEDLYFWRGILIPNEWIENKSLDPKTALTWPNIEQRRAACEILGWEKILKQLDAKVIDTDDPSIGQLVEVELPDAGRQRFLRVMCATKRAFSLPVPPNMRTAMEAQAWTFGMTEKEFVPPDVRT